MDTIQKLNFIVAHPDTGHLLYGFMDHLAGGRDLTEAQITRIDEIYDSVVTNSIKPCMRKKKPYEQYVENRNQKIKLWLERLKQEQLKRKERINPTRDAKNARIELKKELGLRKTFYGVFEKFGVKENWYTDDVQTTIVLQDIVDEDNNLVADHIWLNFTKGFQKLSDLRKNDWLQFDARIRQYKKGYVNFKKDIGMRYVDYTLGYPTKIKKI